MQKILLQNAYIVIHKFDIICISETYLNANALPDDSNLEISGYNLNDLIILQTINEEVLYIL